jgi:hypothetical protein
MLTRIQTKLELYFLFSHFFLLSYAGGEKQTILLPVPPPLKKPRVRPTTLQFQLKPFDFTKSALEKRKSGFDSIDLAIESVSKDTDSVTTPQGGEWLTSTPKRPRVSSKSGDKKEKKVKEVKEKKVKEVKEKKVKEVKEKKVKEVKEKKVKEVKENTCKMCNVCITSLMVYLQTCQNE